MRAEVESLLAAHGGADGFLEQTPAEALLAAAAGPAEAPLGRRVGPYRLVSELGRGGMGTVYLAERADGGFEQRVALKVIRKSIVSEALLDRFLRERQILARLEHPHIARLLDGGLGEDGAPYFAMELVRGTPLNEHCDARRLPIAARLELFDQACRAVQHAHASLVVHRDFKPSNVLVTEDGGVKLLDFGIAKVLSEEPEADGAALTRAGLQPLTPEYAAPEQLRGQPATTSTDLYALGVVLYELLTGRRPTRSPGDGGPGLPAGEPEPPSAAVARPRTAQVGDSEAGTSAAAVAAARATTPRRLRRTLAGDLGAIVMQAVQSDPAQRYPSVEALAEDLHRYRAGLPVRARRATLRYRLGKFVRRNRLTVGAVAAGVVALFAGTALSLWQADVAARERDAARRQAGRAEQAQRFLESVFLGADPDRAKGAKLTARELLDSGAASVGEALAEEPELRAEMLALLGSVYQQLGLYAEARGLFERAHALLLELHDESHPEVAASYRRLGLVHHNAADYGGARPLLERALLLDERRGDPLATAASLNSLALLRRAEGDYSEARRLVERAVELIGRHDRPDSPTLARSLNTLGNVLWRLRDHREAARVFERALAIHRKNEGELSSLVVGTEDNLAMMLAELGDLEGARQHSERAVSIAERLYDRPHRLLALVLNSAGSLAAKRGERRRAVELYQRAIETYEASLGPDHPDLAYTLRNLAIERGADGELREALALYRRALAIRSQALGPEHALVASSWSDVALTQRDLGDLAAAEEAAQRALAICRQTLGEHGQTASTLLDLAEILARAGRAAEAEPLAAEALAIRKARLPAGDPAIAEAEAALAAARTKG
jgi:serine/threonine-protein kinase